MFTINLEYIKQQKNIKYFVLDTKVFKILYKKSTKIENN